MRQQGAAHVRIHCHRFFLYIHRRKYTCISIYMQFLFLFLYFSFSFCCVCVRAHSHCGIANARVELGLADILLGFRGHGFPCSAKPRALWKSQSFIHEIPRAAFFLSRSFSLSLFSLSIALTLFFFHRTMETETTFACIFRRSHPLAFLGFRRLFGPAASSQNTDDSLQAAIGFIYTIHVDTLRSPPDRIHTPPAYTARLIP